MALFKRKAGVPPDVGQEEPEQETGKPEDDAPEGNDQPMDTPVPSTGTNAGRDSAPLQNRLEKMMARMETLDSVVKDYSQRFSSISQQIGELRAMNLSNEKSISKYSSEASKFTDMLRAMEPEKLGIQYRKVDARLLRMEEKTEFLATFIENALDEMTGLRKKLESISGLDAVLDLNSEVKHDMLEVQSVASRVKGHADKAEQLFIEVSKSFTEMQKAQETVNTISAEFSQLKKDISRLSMDYSGLVKRSDFSDFTKTSGKRISFIESRLNDIDKLQKRHDSLTRDLESAVSLIHKNKSDIDRIAISLGDSHIKSVDDYNSRFSSILGILDSLAGEIAAIKKRMGGGRQQKIPVRPTRKSHKDRKGLRMKNMDVHPELAEPHVKTYDTRELEKKIRMVRKLMKEFD